jgi:hypothetical protein
MNDTEALVARYHVGNVLGDWVRRYRFKWGKTLKCNQLCSKLELVTRM